MHVFGLAKYRLRSIFQTSAEYTGNVQYGRVINYKCPLGFFITINYLCCVLFVVFKISYNISVDFNLTSHIARKPLLAKHVTRKFLVAKKI